MIHATKPELEAIIRDAADGLIEAWSICVFNEELARDAISKLIAAEIALAAANETETRLCWWSSLAGCGLTLAGLWLARVFA